MFRSVITAGCNLARSAARSAGKQTHPSPSCAIHCNPACAAPARSHPMRYTPSDAPRATRHPKDRETYPEYRLLVWTLTPGDRLACEKPAALPNRLAVLLQLFLADRYTAPWIVLAR